MPTPQPSTDTEVIVIGAGPAGAAAARVLTAAGVHTVLLDREHAVGGRTRTDRKHGFAIDSGAIFVMGTYRRTRSAIAGAGREHHMRRWVARTELREARGRYPVRFDAPHTFLRVPQLRWTDRVRLVAGIAMLMLRRGPEPFDLRSLADDDNGETMEAWSRRMFGDRVHEYVVRPLMEPLTGADLSTISRSFLVALLRNAHRTRLTVPEDGLDRVTSWQLDDVDVRLNVHVESVRRESAGLAVHAADGVLTARAVIVATDAHTAAELCTDVLGAAELDALRRVQAILCTTWHSAFAPIPGRMPAPTWSCRSVPAHTPISGSCWASDADRARRPRGAKWSASTSTARAQQRSATGNCSPRHDAS